MYTILPNPSAVLKFPLSVKEDEGGGFVSYSNADITVELDLSELVNALSQGQPFGGLSAGTIKLIAMSGDTFEIQLRTLYD